MNRKEMELILKELEEQLTSGKQLDDYHRRKVNILSQHIKDVLAVGDEKLSGDQFLIKKLEQVIDDFEINHPQLTILVGRISDLLAGGGL